MRKTKTKEHNNSEKGDHSPKKTEKAKRKKVEQKKQQEKKERQKKREKKKKTKKVAKAESNRDVVEIEEIGRKIKGTLHKIFSFSTNTRPFSKLFRFFESSHRVLSPNVAEVRLAHRNSCKNGV